MAEGLNRNILYRVLFLLRESAARQTVLNVFLQLTRALVPVIVVLLIRSLVDMLMNSPEANDIFPGGRAGLMVSALAIALLADDLLASAGYLTARRQSVVLEQHISGLIHEKRAEISLRFIEDPAYQDLLSRAVRDMSWRPADIINNMIFILRGAASFIAMALIIIRYNTLLLAVLIAAFVPLALIKSANSKRVYQTRKSLTEAQRNTSYFSWLLTGERPAREVRLFGLERFFENIFIKYFRKTREQELRVAAANVRLEMVASIIKISAIAGILIYTGYALINATITAGEAAMYLLAFRQASVYLRDTVNGWAGLNENRLFITDLFQFLDLKTGTGKKSMTPIPGFSAINVRELVFRYPGMKEPALKSISMDIRRGEKIAIVGPNGSGKTTLVKLLCRLYEPESGSVSLDGIDTKNFDEEGYRKLFSVVFQDFMLYYLTAAENIGLGDWQAMGDEHRMRKAATGAGIDGLLSALPRGYETMLGHHSEGGRDLSWGEWQKIAVARALFREAPVLIFDEPSSSLDADSEYEIFSSIRKEARDRTSIIISHRLAFVSDADKIFFLSNGVITEEGTHDHLMAIKGEYYRMYTRQKSLFT